MRQPTAFTLIELLVTLAIAAVLATMAVHIWSSHRTRAQKASVRAALAAAMAELEQQHIQAGKYEVPNGVLGQTGGYQLFAQLCHDGNRAQCVEVAAQPMQPDTTCGTLILRSTGERFIQFGDTRQSASHACWP
ncbi:hypothetical protein PI87_10450 [Ralstonia sp. A12]|uniref:type IV pilin protein n=1 Tax=Ralstonia sp. A12 TaxID=1217052 RepID=UPI00057466FA|nr:prepilin-type N-terminal cleavage/methylation domain-containing protein [Ralstonia sp. A12]KHK56140.1 hypothetical protein PI87_10450 [Ralstonia sp. A12]